MPGVSELDPAFTVGEHLRERALLQGRYGASLRTLLRPRAERRATARARIDAALEAAGLDTAALPKAERTSVRDLERLEALRLSVALALIGTPGCWRWTTPTSSSPPPNGPTPGSCCARSRTPAPPCSPCAARPPRTP